MTDDEILARAEEIKRLRAEAAAGRAQIIENRAKALRRGMVAAKFTSEELVYAAAERCCCGAGMAYPKGCGPHHWWDCSAILLGEAAPGSTHSDGMPFAFWSVLSEEQKARTGGATTRPAPEEMT